jgi:lysophospholipase L1-like esterase
LRKNNPHHRRGRKGNTANSVLSWVINIAICACIIIVIVLLVKDGVFGSFSLGEPIGGSGNTDGDSIFTTVLTEKAVTEEPPLETRIISQTTVTTVTTTAETTEETAETSADTSSMAQGGTNDYDYDKEFFDNYLFIGDSISTGLYGYGYLSSSNVFAKIGLTPVSVRTADVNGTTVYQKMTVNNPAAVCIMLGTNGLSYLDTDDMIDSFTLFVDEIKETVPDTEIVILSIPPVTKEHEDTKPENNTVIKEYNAGLKQLAEDKDLTFIDVYSMLADEDGYMRADYAEKDGLHLQGAAYKRILYEIETDATS